MKASSYKSLKAKADKLFSEYIRREGVCLMSGLANTPSCAGRLECCHVKSRRYLCLRWDPSNALPLCSAHHRHSHDHPDVFVGFVDRSFPLRLDYLNKKMQELGGKVDIEEVIKGLEGLKKEVYRVELDKDGWPVLGGL